MRDLLTGCPEQCLDEEDMPDTTGEYHDTGHCVVHDTVIYGPVCLYCRDGIEPPDYNRPFSEATHENT